ncbi:MAG TPA: GNAT family N-acetyltransferase [Stellaceae bacterium]|nr:GNAT family N-acetyltransferase [Stellaceae bacterium]
MLLHPAAPPDIPRLQDIEKAARTRYLSAGRLAFAAETPPIAANRLAEDDVIVAEADGCLVGFVLMNPMDGVLYIANISVGPGFSGRGIGAALIEAAERHAISTGLAGIALTTFRTPQWDAPWFRRLGFRPMPTDLIGPSLRALLERHRQFLDMRTRVTLWRPICAAECHRA